jgi:hypothetical protein
VLLQLKPIPSPLSFRKGESVPDLQSQGRQDRIRVPDWDLFVIAPFDSHLGYAWT